MGDTEMVLEDNEILLDIDLVLATFTREELLSALGFDTPGDYLSEVTISDVINHFSESAVASEIDINDYWDAEGAVNRYGTDILEYFGSYSNTEDWSACDYIENYGDTECMLEVLLTNYVGLQGLATVLLNTHSKEQLRILQEKLGVAPKVKHVMLEVLLKANYEVQKESRCITLT